MTETLGHWHFTVWGKPQTKKTSNEIAMVKGKIRVFPNPKWRKWAKDAPMTGLRFQGSAPLRAKGTRLNCRAHFYRDANRGDAVGYYQGLADLLEKRGIVFNDSQIVSWDGSRLFVDKDQPRVEVTLEEVG